MSLAAAFLLLAVAGCRKQHLAAADVQQAAQRFALAPAGSNEVQLMLDSSASMRGFALAAVQEQQAAAGAWPSLFVGLEAVGSKLRLARFGGTLEEQSGPVALFPLAVGSRPAASLGGRPIESRWRSRSCSGQPLRGGAAVAAIDSTFSETETCLGLALAEATKSPTDPSLRIVLTDSEQAAGDESVGCPLGNNPTPVQDRLYDWVHGIGNYAAIGVFRLPYAGWRVAAPTRDYCGCSKRNLFAYLMSTSAKSVEEAFARLASHWHGEPADLAYLPLAPRPAHQYHLKLTVAKTPSGDVPASIEGAHQRLQPDAGQLPVFFLRLDDDRAVVQFTLTKGALDQPLLRETAGSRPARPRGGDLAWRDEPVLVSFAAAGKSGKERSATLMPGGGGLEFVRLPDAGKVAGQEAYVREADFLATPKRAADSELSEIQLTGTWEIHRRSTAQKGSCELYLFELYAAGDRLVERLIGATPLLRGQDACSGLDSITAQVRHVYREAPVARFLLHIDA